MEEERFNEILNDVWNMIFSGENDDKTGREMREILEEKYGVHDVRMFLNIMQPPTKIKTRFSARIGHWAAHPVVTRGS